MAVDKWFVSFVNATPTDRRTMLQGKTKEELIKISRYYRLPVVGNSTHLKNQLATSRITLPIN